MSLPSSAGGFTKHGKFYTCTTVTSADKVKELLVAIRAAQALPGATKVVTWILSGTHGTDKGVLVQEKKFFYEDKLLEGQMYKSVNVYGFTGSNGAIVKTRWDEYTSKKGIVILAWCYSEQARNGWMKTAGLKEISG